MQVFIQMYQDHAQFKVLLLCMDEDQAQDALPPPSPMRSPPGSTPLLSGSGSGSGSAYGQQAETAGLWGGYVPLGTSSPTSPAPSWSMLPPLSPLMSGDTTDPTSSSQLLLTTHPLGVTAMESQHSLDAIAEWMPYLSASSMSGSLDTEALERAARSAPIPEGAVEGEGNRDRCLSKGVGSDGRADVA